MNAPARPRSPASGNALGVLHEHGISHGDLRSREITVDEGEVLFGGFGYAEFGATDVPLQADIAQLLVTTTDALRRRSRGDGRHRRVRQGHRAHGVAATHEIGCAEPYPGHAGRRRRRVDGSARRGQEADGRRSRSRPRPSPGSPATRSSSWCCSSAWSTSRTRSSAGADVLHRTAHGELVVGAVGPGGVGAHLCRGRGRTVGVRHGAGQLPQPGVHAVREHLRRHHHPRRRRRTGAEHTVPAEGRPRRGASDRRGRAAAGACR